MRKTTASISSTISDRFYTDHTPELRLQEIIDDLESTEFEVLAKIRGCITGNLAEPPGEETEESQDEECGQTQGSRWESVSRSFKRGAKTLIPALSRWRGQVGECMVLSQPVARWYGIRERVLELLGQRETLRERLLFHQASVAAS
jgi:hypothetical protein